MQGIKEIKELLAGLEMIAKAGKKISADGKVNVDDLPVLIGLVSEAAVLVEAFKGLDQIPAEAKDLSAEELKEIVDVVFAAVAKVKAA